MNYYVMTLFPEMIEQGMHTSITGRAIGKGLLSLTTVNIRDFSVTGNGRIDDYPYGGGAGMVMQAEPVYRAYGALKEKIRGRARVIYLTPQGRVFCQRMAQEFAQEENLVFLCGHYEGVDERVLDEIVTDRVSIGDYVLTGGELPSMVMMDAISRMVPGVLSNAESGVSESFSDALLEYPQYSRPEIWRGRSVPPVLLSGHHGKVDRWRRDQSILRTLHVRPELLREASFDKKDRKFMEELQKEPGEEPVTAEEREILQELLKQMRGSGSAAGKMGVPRSFPEQAGKEEPEIAVEERKFTQVLPEQAGKEEPEITVEERKILQELPEQEKEE